MTRISMTIAALLTLSGTALPSAALADDVASMRVSYADLNLAGNEGRDVLKRRIDFAARSVCQIEDSKELSLALVTRICRQDAVLRAQPAYDAAISNARHGIVTVADTAALVITSH